MRRVPGMVMQVGSNIGATGAAAEHPRALLRLHLEASLVWVTHGPTV